MKNLSVVLVLLCSLFFFAVNSSGEEADDYTRGVEAFQAGNYRQATTLLTEALRASPDDSVVLYNLGVAYFYLGESFLATEKFNTALLVNAEFPEVYYALGSLFLKSKRGELARVNFKKACDLGFSKGCIVYKNL